MAYHYRVTDQPPPLHVQHHRSPSFSYFAEQAIPDFGRSYGHFQSPMDMREALVREDEKERIRGGIIAEEIARFRILDAELRRQGIGISSAGMPARRGFGHFEMVPFNEPRVGLSISEVPFEQQSVKPMISVIPPKNHSVKSRIMESKLPSDPENLSKELQIWGVGATSERGKEKEQLRANKPDATLSGVKRRAEMAAEAVISSNLPTTGVPKNTAVLIQNTHKSKELPMKKFKFWCDLCNVGAFTENLMKERERGKKHTVMLREMNTNGIVTQMKKPEKGAEKDYRILFMEPSNSEAVKKNCLHSS